MYRRDNRTRVAYPFDFCCAVAWSANCVRGVSPRPSLTGNEHRIPNDRLWNQVTTLDRHCAPLCIFFCYLSVQVIARFLKVSYRGNAHLHSINVFRIFPLKIHQLII